MITIKLKRNYHTVSMFEIWTKEGVYHNHFRLNEKLEINEGIYKLKCNEDKINKKHISIIDDNDKEIAKMTSIESKGNLIIRKHLLKDIYNLIKKTSDNKIIIKS